LFELNFFIPPQLENDAILGWQIKKEHGISLNFESERFMYFKGGTVKKHLF
jgi:hypothetical protein